MNSRQRSRGVQWIRSMNETYDDARPAWHVVRCPRGRAGAPGAAVVGVLTVDAPSCDHAHQSCRPLLLTRCNGFVRFIVNRQILALAWIRTRAQVS